MSLRDQILAADDLTSEIVDVPEWGVKLALKSPTGEERALLLRQTVDDDGERAEGAWQMLWPLAFVACAHDPETGERVFSFDDVDELQSKNGAVLNRLGDQCLRISGLQGDAVEDAKKSVAPGT